jgi:uroporphyrinogen-III synthase
VRALAAHGGRRDILLWTVGDATARCARDLGFIVGGCAKGDVDSLAALVTAQLDPARGTLLHAAGAHRAGNLAETLMARGYTTRRVVLYEAEEAATVAPALAAALAHDSLAGALFFSPRTAATFVRLVAAAGLDRHCRRLAAVCLSPAVAERLTGLPWHSVRVAAEARQESLLAALDGVAGMAPVTKQGNTWDAS